MVKPVDAAQIGFWVKHEKRLRSTALVLAAAAVVIQGARVYFWPHDDLGLHWEFGRRFRAGEFLYAGGLHVPYPPFWGMMAAPLSWVSLTTVRIVAFPLGLLTLAALMTTLNRDTSRRLPLDRVPLFWCTAFTLLLASRFILRDMTECSMNTALLALSWLALSLWMRGRDLLAGCCMGLAIALKCTPALFLPYFALKRQWKMLSLTVAAAAAFSAAPILWHGPELYAKHAAAWSLAVWQGVAGTDPSAGILGQDEVKNFALRPALARYLTHLPAGHPGRPDHPGYLDLLDLSGPSAAWLIRSLLAALIIAVAWEFRHPLQQRAGLTTLWECSAVFLLMLLLSPITWEQHAVAAIPALYLIVRTLLVTRLLSRKEAVALALYGLFVLLLNRELVGRPNWILLNSYHVITGSLGLLLLLALAHRRRCAAPN